MSLDKKIAKEMQFWYLNHYEQLKYTNFTKKDVFTYFNMIYNAKKITGEIKYGI
jgi:hypothetical protein